jgi:hypothetical protein
MLQMTLATRASFVISAAGDIRLSRCAGPVPTYPEVLQLKLQKSGARL